MQSLRIDHLKHIIPPLSKTLHKGQAGKIGVLGGSFEYTGAPYYSAISSLYTGSDLSYVICTKGAAVPIKSYSPELIVLPLLRTSKEMQKDSTNLNEVIENVSTWLKPLHTLVVGPGLGRDPFVIICTKEIIRIAREKSIPLVIDGDGLWVVNQDTSIIKGYKQAILTPNVVEYSRLCKVVLDIEPSPEEDVQTSLNTLKTLAEKLGNVTIIRKGTSDLISDGIDSIECDADSSPRRCGGQGDILSGITATFFSWLVDWNKKNESKGEEKKLITTLDVCYSSCLLVRSSAVSAFEKHHRGTTTTNILEHIAPNFQKIFGQ